MPWLAARPLAINDHSFQWHLFSALVLSLSLILYLGHLCLTGSRPFNKLLPSTRLSSRWNMTILAFWSLCSMAISGWLMQLESGLDRAVLVSAHWLFLSILCASLFGHILLELKARSIPGIWRFWTGNNDLQPSRLILLAFAASAILVLLVQALNWSKPLDVPLVKIAPRIDGKLNDSGWQSAQTTRVYLHNHNAKDWFSRTRGNAVEVRAVRDAERLYVSFRWQDQSKSLAHLPLYFNSTTADWELLAEGFWIDDERQFYEDKFAVLLSNDGLMAAMRSIHLGDKILGSAPIPRHKRGYHYFSNDELADVWHWKATRTNPFVSGR